jgi:hypothetical protein
MAAKKRAPAKARTPAPHQPAPRKSEKLELAPEWQRWATENLLGGATRAEVARGLEAEGVPEDVLGPALDAIVRSPVFLAALPFARESRRLRNFARLHRAIGKSAPRPTRIARLPFPGVDAFYERFVATSTPAIFPDLVPTWPAFGKWTPETLRERFGEVPIRITDERESDVDYDMFHERHTREVALSAYVDRILASGETNDFYMVANNRNLARTALSAMLDDVSLPEGLLQTERLKDATALWLGPAGTVTPLHHDTSNILFCQLVGRKRYKMISPWEIGVLDGARAMYAAVDPEKPDLERFPWWPDVTVKEEVLAPGDALFIPVGWWHHVRALDVSLSVAMNCFVTPNRFDWFVPSRD